MYIFTLTYLVIHFNQLTIVFFFVLILLFLENIVSFCSTAGNRLALIEAISNVCRESNWEGAEGYCVAMTKAINDGQHDEHLVCILLFYFLSCCAFDVC